MELTNYHVQVGFKTPKLRSYTAVICMTHLLTPGNGASFVQREADSYVP